MLIIKPVKYVNSSVQGHTHPLTHPSVSCWVL